jgi:putative hydrolase of the HAD superfamily
MLAETDVHPGEYEEILQKIRAGAASRVLEAYDEVPSSLAALRERGLRLVVCSNWDWDLVEAVAEAGLTGAFDALVSSAWVGARKPHSRIYARALDEAGVAPGAAVFVGDTWGPDVAGPRAAGIRAVYVRREGHWPDGTRPPDEPGASGAPVVPDLTGLLDLLEGAAVPWAHDES